MTHPPKQNAIATKDIFEVDNRTSRHMGHIKKGSTQMGWMPNKNDVRRLNRYKGHMQDRGTSYMLGDARAAKAVM
eukprot:CAMPEP_0197232616 /NCGR_PEP_ID=MMETSP1429-20130617/872_1 /TAXON_ID=49237 /ORGANISM="Chaetoceros  sp., Strain UNC1202" /LENGTH=74 /DNA_ID=CAMNT_0042690691 /DNA_START=109 /DNA_END=333 /DNA_ORIENTATION=+